MSDREKDFHRRLRYLIGGTVEDANGVRTLFHPLRSYDNVCEVRRHLGREIADPRILNKEAASLLRQLNQVIKEQADLKERILKDVARPRKSSPRSINPLPMTVDHGLKNMVEKALEDAEAGESPDKCQSVEAVLCCLSFFLTHGHAPSHAKLLEYGYTNQQATDARAWLKMQDDVSTDPLLPRLKELRGRPKKK
jgi:hypothetical protein